MTRASRPLLTALFAVAIASCGPSAGVPPGSGPVPGRDGVPLPEGVEIDPLDAEAEGVASGFRIPWAVEVLGPDEFLVSERFGELVHLHDGERTVLEGLPETRVSSAQGLFLGGYNDVSLHPDFAANGLVYLAYVTTGGQMAVLRFDFSDRAVRDVETVFVSNAFSIGSRIAWPDADHFLVTQGGGGGWPGVPAPDPGPQDPGGDIGKIHRLRADGSVPDDNPVFDGADGPTSLWSLGHRDPQGLLVDADGAVYATEHGPLGGDELNRIEPGGNYGWPLFSYGLTYDRSPVGEMTEAEAAATTVLPVKAWGPEFNMAPSGLVRLAGSAFPAWDGWLLWGALAQRRLVAYDPASDRTAVLLDDVGRVRDVAQLPSGDLLILLDATGPETPDGQVVRLRPR